MRKKKQVHQIWEVQLEIMEYINYLKPKKTIFTHMTALIDEENINNKCSKNIFAGYDGMEIII